MYSASNKCRYSSGHKQSSDPQVSSTAGSNTFLWIPLEESFFSRMRCVLVRSFCIAGNRRCCQVRFRLDARHSFSVTMLVIIPSLMYTIGGEDGA